jgi:aspartate/methionine/tyrosine aminotransferase
MVPGPVQAAGAVALSDDSHVIDQRARYLGRLERLASALGVAGVPVTLPEGGFYLWVPVPPEVSTAAHSTSARSGSAGGESPSWRFARTLASRAGVLVSPGEFYGSAGEGFVRIAAVAPDDRIEMVAGRIAALGQGWMV